MASSWTRGIAAGTRSLPAAPWHEVANHLDRSGCWEPEAYPPEPPGSLPIRGRLPGNSARVQSSLDGQRRRRRVPA